MAGLDHGSAGPAEVEDPRAAARRARLGLLLFGVYLALYGGFMALTAFFPSVMAATPLAGVNLAILYGLGLIGAALLLALVYAWLCRSSRTADSEGIS